LNKIQEPENLLSNARKLILDGAFDELTSLLEIKLCVNPFDKESLFASALMYKALGAVEQAINIIKTSEYLKICPGLYWNELGECYTLLRQEQDAIYYFAEGLKAQPEYLILSINLASCYIRQANFTTAIAILKDALKIAPSDPEVNLALTLAIYAQTEDVSKIGTYLPYALKAKNNQRHTILQIAIIKANYDQNISLAKKYADEMMHSFPNLDLTWFYASDTSIQKGDPDQAISHSKKAIQLNPTNNLAHDNLIMYSQYTENISDQEILDNVHHYYESCIKPFLESYAQSFNFSHLFEEESPKLRVGFVSGDVILHPVFFWISSLFKHAPKENLEIYCYVNNQENPYSESLKPNISKIIYVKTQSDLELAKTIYQDHINILVDLSGHTACNRLGVFALKPAPLQVTWLGQSGPMGLPQIDYGITDRFLIKEGEDELYTEKPYRLPHSFAPYPAADYGNLTINRELIYTDGSIILGSLNNSIKINKEVIRIWSLILSKTPQSKLLFKNFNVQYLEYQRQILQMFVENGVDQSRIIFELPSPKSEFLKTFNTIDIALDPFPLTGGTTTHETLMMSVPLVTLAGKRAPHRVGESILSSANLPELIAYSKDEYINKIIELINDPVRIINYKQTIREIYLNSPATDMEGFAQDFFYGLKELWGKTKETMK
jgi:predicted O-linked N-acetylglucosamine transferase (SPINDLY family)